jgi:hypothetical protein
MNPIRFAGLTGLPAIDEILCACDAVARPD